MRPPSTPAPRAPRALLAAALVVAVLVAAAGPPAPAVMAAGERAPGLAAMLRAPHADDRVIVTYEPGTAPRNRTASLSEIEAAAVRKVSPRSRGTFVVTLAAGQTVADAIVSLRSEPGVSSVEPDYLLRPAADADDPHYLDGDLWGMYGDATTPANPFGSGAAEAWARGFTGDREVHVGIIDAGVQVNHPDLAANIWVNPWEPVNGRDDDGNGYVDDIHGWDFAGDDATVFDGTGQDWHGTHVAGTVGAQGGNGIGVAGVDWKVTLIVAKFIAPDHGYTSEAIEAIDYITDLKLRHGLEVAVTNNSWSGEAGSAALLDAIERAGDAGILFVAAAGNDTLDIDDDPRYPAAFRCDERADGRDRGWDCIISVASLRSDGSLAPESNRGTASVDLGAPGSGIVSTLPGGTYGPLNGTSMATPHVAGAVALCASLDGSLSARQVRAQVVTTAAPTASLEGVTATGGRLDIGALAEACAPPPPTTKTIYVDDLGAGFRRFGKGWRAGSSGYAGHHFYAPVRKGSRSAYASWKPVLPAAGRYIVQAFIPAQHATSRKAAYRVKTLEGWVTRVRSQHARRGSWVSLGVHELSRFPIVQLANVTGERRGRGRTLAFDAVRIIPYGVPASAQDR